MEAVSGLTILVFGGRDYDNRVRVFAVLDRVHAERGIARLIHGACSVGHGGADMLADVWAKSRGVPIQAFPVDHALDGPWPGAGPNRNGRMLREGKPDGAVGFPGGNGTRSMMWQARKAEVPVMVIA